MQCAIRMAADPETFDLGAVLEVKGWSSNALDIIEIAKVAKWLTKKFAAPEWAR